MPKRTAGADPGAEPILDAGRLARFTAGIMGDLDALRRGHISLEDARARARLAHEALRGVSLMLSAQRFLSQQARTVLGEGMEVLRAPPPCPGDDPGGDSSPTSQGWEP